MKEKKKKNDNFAMGLIGLFFLASSTFFCGYVFYEDKLNLNMNGGEGQADFSSVRKVGELDSINEHLKTVSDKMELQRMKNELANMKVSHSNNANEVVSLSSPEEVGRPIVDFSDDPRNRRLAEELGRTSELKKVPKDPRSVVYNSVIEDRRVQKIKASERKQQAKDFVANARKDGWIVSVDENYKIKSYRRVEDSDVRPQDVDYKGFEVIPK